MGNMALVSKRFVYSFPRKFARDIIHFRPRKEIARGYDSTLA